jgi:hypothetical protein
MKETVKQYRIVDAYPVGNGITVSDLVNAGSGIIFPDLTFFLQ